MRRKDGPDLLIAGQMRLRRVDVRICGKKTNIT